MSIEAKFPELLEGLFRPKRFKVLWGGRAAGRSWGCARALLLIGVQKPIRVLCCRELQKSISESVHKLLSDQIVNLGLEDFYEIQQARIIGKNGTTFAFEGIKNNTTSIKSYEKIEYCWVEEANKVSKASWQILIPTIIRNPGAEIWLTFNPELETDYTYTRFVKDPDLKRMNKVSEVDGVTQLSWLENDSSLVVKMTYQDNPWIDAGVLEEIERDKKRDYDTYLNVWEGHTVQNLEGAVFAKELRRAREQNRITLVPWDRETPVDTFWDLGRRDLTAIWFAQKVGLQYRVLSYFEDRGEDIHYYLRACQAKPYVYGTFYMPHDAAAKRLGEKRSIKQIVQSMGKQVHIVPRTQRKSNAINAARIIFSNCWFDADETSDGVQRLSHYRYRVSEGQFSDEPLHDDNSNGADAFMTFAQAMAGPPAVSGVGERLRRASEAWRGESHGAQDWMA